MRLSAQKSAEPYTLQKKLIDYAPDFASLIQWRPDHDLCCYRQLHQVQVHRLR